MRKVLILLFFMSILFAVPNKIAYQGKITDADNAGITDVMPMEFRIFNTQTGGIALWSESYTDADEIEIEHGLFEVQLGTINEIDIPFDEQYWLEIVIDGDIMTPRVLLASVGYSFTSAIAESVYAGQYIKTLNLVTPSPSSNIDLVEGENITITEIPDSNKIRISSASAAVSNPLIVGNIIDPGEIQVANGAGANRIIAKGNNAQPGVKVNKGNAGVNGLEAEAQGAGSAIKARNDDIAGEAARIIGNLMIQNAMEENVITTYPNRGSEGPLQELQIPNDSYFSTGVKINDTYGHADGFVASVSGEKSAIKGENLDLTGNAGDFKGNLIVRDIDGNQVFKVDVETGNVIMNAHFLDSLDGEITLLSEATGDGGIAISGISTSETGSGIAIDGVTNSCGDSSAAVQGKAMCASALGYGVKGVSYSIAEGTAGIYGEASSPDILGTGGNKYGVYGFTATNQSGAGVYGHSKDGNNPLFGVKGYTESGDNYSAGVFGLADSSIGVYGKITNDADQIGAVTGHIVYGTTGQGNGILGINESDVDSSCGVRGIANSSTSLSFGVRGDIITNESGSAGVLGNCLGDSKSYGVLGFTDASWDSSAGVCGMTSTGSSSLNYGVKGISYLVTEGTAGVYGEASTPDLLGSGGNKYGVYGFTATNQNGAGVYGHSKDGNNPVFGVKGYTESGDEYSAGVYGIADSALGVYGSIRLDADEKGAVMGHVQSTADGKGYGVFGLNEADVDSSTGIMGVAGGSNTSFGVRGVTISTGDASAGLYGSATDASSQSYGVFGRTSSNHPDAAGVLGESKADFSYGLLGISGGINGYGVSSKGKFGVHDISGDQTLLIVDPTYNSLTLYDTDGTELTKFGGITDRVAIQTINTSATPTIPANNFTIEGVAPITVTTNDHGITISADTIGGALGDTVQAEYFIAGTDSADGGMLFRREDGLITPLEIKTVCSTDPLFSLTSVDACPDIPAVLRACYDGSYMVPDTFPKAAIKGIWSVNKSGWDEADTTGYGIMGYSRASGFAGMYAIGDDPLTTGYEIPVNGLLAITNSVNTYGAAVRAEAIGETGKTYSFYGRNTSTGDNAAAVFGTMEPTSNSYRNYGVHGYNSSTHIQSAAVYGEKWNEGGAGILGLSYNSNSFAGLFRGAFKVQKTSTLEGCQELFKVDPFTGKLNFYDEYCEKLVEWRAPDDPSLDFYAESRFFEDLGIYGITPDSVEFINFNATNGISMNTNGGVFYYEGTGIYAGDSIRFKSSGDAYFSGDMTIEGEITASDADLTASAIGNLVVNIFRGSASNPINLESTLDGTGKEIICDQLTVNNVSSHTVNGDLDVNTDMGLGGNVNVAGDLTVSGTKNFIMPHPLDEKKSIKFVCTEANQVIIEHRATISLVRGYAEFEIPAEFILVAESGTFSVNATPQTLADPGRLGAIIENGKVKVKAHGTDEDYEVSLIISAIRKGYIDYDSIVEREKD